MHCTVSIKIHLHFDFKESAALVDEKKDMETKTKKLLLVSLSY